MTWNQNGNGFPPVPGFAPGPQAPTPGYAPQQPGQPQPGTQQGYAPAGYAQPPQYGQPQGFGQPPQYGYAQQPQHFGGAPQQAHGDIGSAVDGLNDAEARLPLVPPDVHVQARVTGFRAPKTAFGLMVFVEGEILQSSVPSLVGSLMTVGKISGFDSMKGKKFAQADLRACLVAIHARSGLTNATQLSKEEWQGLVIETGKPGVQHTGIGAVINTSSRMVMPQGGGKAKQVFTFSAPQG